MIPLGIPHEWIEYIFEKRREAIERMLSGNVDSRDIYLGFTRTVPAIVSYGSAGLNASVKMIGLVPKEDIIDDLYAKVIELVEKKPSMQIVTKFLLNEIYVRDLIDFSKLFTLDLARKNTWRNVNENPDVVLIFYTPPDISFMVRAKATIHTDDIYYRYANAIHDIFHVVPKKGKIVSRAPTYIFNIKEIWNKSADKFGVKIYP